jgi:hypothetical protein
MSQLNVEEQPDIMDVRRIVGLKILGWQRSAIDRRGLCFQLLVRCHKCLLLRVTGKQQYSLNRKKCIHIVYII